MSSFVRLIKISVGESVQENVRLARGRNHRGPLAGEAAQTTEMQDKPRVKTWKQPRDGRGTRPGSLRGRVAGADPPRGTALLPLPPQLPVDARPGGRVGRRAVQAPQGAKALLRNPRSLSEGGWPLVSRKGHSVETLPLLNSGCQPVGERPCLVLSTRSRSPCLLALCGCR